MSWGFQKVRQTSEEEQQQQQDQNGTCWPALRLVKNNENLDPFEGLEGW